MSAAVLCRLSEAVQTNEDSFQNSCTGLESLKNNDNKIPLPVSSSTWFYVLGSRLDFLPTTKQLKAYILCLQFIQRMVGTLLGTFKRFIFIALRVFKPLKNRARVLKRT